MSARTLQDDMALLVDAGRKTAALEAGMEFTSLIPVGAEMLAGGEWRTVTSVSPASGDRVQVVMADGSEFVSDRTCVRHFRIGAES